jgi:hypothetical protein
VGLRPDLGCGIPPRCLLVVMALAGLILSGCGGAGGAGAAHRERPQVRVASASRGPVVLGSKDFITWGASGFGTAHPTDLVVGSDPSVQITNIRWHGWGRWRTSGVGWYKVPTGLGGDYYYHRTRADLLAFGIGRCQPGAPRTYMALKVRMKLQPDQRPGWYDVSGSHALCSYP